MKIITFLYKNNIESAEIGIIKMQPLIFHKEKGVKEELIRAYWTLFFDDTQYSQKDIASHLIKLFKVKFYLSLYMQYLLL